MFFFGVILRLETPDKIRDDRFLIARGNDGTEAVLLFGRSIVPVFLNTEQSHDHHVQKVQGGRDGRTV